MIEREGKKLHRYRAKDYRIYFEKRRGRDHRPSRPAQEHVSRLSFPQQTADGGRRSARQRPRVLEINRTGRADAEESLIAALDADEDLRRREFPICARKIYCAHAADAPLPRRVADAMRESIERASSDARQYDLELERIAETRKAVARFLGAQADEISFTGPTSSGLNAIANGLDWAQRRRSRLLSR